MKKDIIIILKNIAIPGVISIYILSVIEELKVELVLGLFGYLLLICLFGFLFFRFIDSKSEKDE